MAKRADRPAAVGLRAEPRTQPLAAPETLVSPLPDQAATPFVEIKKRH